MQSSDDDWLVLSNDLEIVLLKMNHKIITIYASRALAFFFAVGLVGAYDCFAFGMSGQNGADGKNGTDGTKGRHISIKAQGQYAAFDLSGEDGIAGTDGLPGTSAAACKQSSNRSSDQSGAPGGYGGNGGDGGDGGDGGNVTIFFNDLSNLRKIQVISLGGKGGNGGFGAYGGEGCACTLFSWQMTECRSKPAFKVENCRVKQFFCRDGRGGQHGLLGNKGSKGAKGTAILIPQLDPLPEAQNKLTIKLRSWERLGARLSAHRFKVHYGANKLFASGSKLSSRYLLYEGLWEANIKLRWNANRLISEFEDVEAVLFAKENHSKHFEEIGIQFSPTFKHKGYLSKEFGILYYTITDAWFDQQQQL